MNRVVANLCSRIVVGMLCSAAVAQSAPVFKLDLPTGPHPVGFRAVQQSDPSRGYKGVYDDVGHRYTGDRGRPMQTMIWYPAEKPRGSAMTYGDYLVYTASEEGPPPADINKATAYARSLLKPALSDPMQAHKDANAEAKKFPVVIYAPSFGASAFENVDICEYLASFGFVVISSPAHGAHQRGMTADQAGISAQAGDISFLIGYAATLPDTDMSEVAVAGYSWGGISNLFAAARDSRIDALVMLDGSARYFPKLVKESGDVHPEQMSLSVLFFTGGESTLEEMETRPPLDGPNVPNEMKYSDVTLVRMHWMHHGNFSSFFFRMDGSQPPNAPHPPPFDNATKDEAVEGYRWVAHYTREFLEANLKNSANATAFLERTPSENGAPRHMFFVEHHASSGVAPSLDNLRGQAGQQGFDHLSTIYADFKKRSPDFSLPENVVNDWGYNLINENHPKEAVAVMKLNTENYPKSTGAWDALGEADKANRDMRSAIAAWQQGLIVDPKNEGLQNKLKEAGPGK